VLTYDTARAGSVGRARRLRRNSTDAERKLWRALRSKLPQFKWRRQMPLGPYFADFACFAEKLIVELDGGQHARATEYDDRRSAFLESQGYRVLRFWNNDALTNTAGLLDRIALELSTSPSRANGAGPSLSQGRGEMES
jgi:very-short-patch-repair endonuclease